MRFNASLQIPENKYLNTKINHKTSRPQMQMISASGSLWKCSLSSSANLGMWTKNQDGVDQRVYPSCSYEYPL